jgi:uncharacterized protein
MIAARLAAVYAAVPNVACKGLCQRACGPIACSATEADVMRDNGINPPGVQTHPTLGAMTCSHLGAAGRCDIYAHRPLVCRLYGAVKALRCEHGCRPAGGFLSEAKARGLLAAVDDGRPPHLSFEVRA